MTYSFTLPLAPVVWKRVQRNRFGATFVPRKTLNYERAVAALSRQHAPAAPLEGPLALVLMFFVPKPKRCKRTHPCVRPDVDNFAKAVMDALGGVFWKDDGQICTLTAMKVYGTPSISVQVTELGGAA